MAKRKPVGLFTEGAHSHPIEGSEAPVPCPFCGGTEFIQVHDVSEEQDGSSCHAQCDDCGAEGPCSDSMLEAAQSWNKRPREGITEELSDQVLRPIWRSISMLEVLRNSADDDEEGLRLMNVTETVIDQLKPLERLL